MGRIRSIHPGQWTDEDFVECGPWARLLAIGLRNEADDNGVFDWRPVRLKMRLFPADAIDVAELLGELTAAGMVMRFEIDGRPYGAIRNFRVFQNPRSPKAEFPTTPAVEAFVGDRTGEGSTEKKAPGRPRKSRDDETNLVEAKSFPQSVENNSLMERRGEERSKSPSDSSIGEPTDQLPPRSLILVPDPSPPAPDEVGTAFAAFAAMRAELKPGCGSIQLGPDRRKQLAARLRENGGPAGWAAILARIRGSPFLRGDVGNGAPTGTNIDWVLKPINLRKITEGNYDDHRSGPAGGPHPARSGAMSAVRAARDRLGLGGS